MSDTEQFLLNIDEDLSSEGNTVSTEEKSLKRVSEESTSPKLKKRKKEMKITKIVPNHFIAFRIYDSIIRQRIQDIQMKITEKNPLLQKAMIDVQTLHVTLAVTHLENEERIKALQEKLQDWGKNDMRSHFNEPIHLTFRGIGTFRKDVAFVKIINCENYKRLCVLSDAMNELLSSAGFYSENKKAFIPHLTLLKLSKNYKLFKDKKSVKGDIDDLNKCEDYFGCQDVEDIQLLSMTAKKDDTGYYKCLWQTKTKEPAPEEIKPESC